MKPSAIMQMATKFQESRIFLTAAEMDVFSLLEKNPMSAGEMAERLKATPRGVTILLNAVVSMGLLEKKEGKYYCPDEVAAVLSRGSKRSIMPMVKLASGGWKRWSELTDIVRHGKGRIKGTVFDIDEEEQEAFSGALFAVNMLVVTTGGRTYSFEEIKSALESAGFIDVNLIQPDERMNGLVECFKP